MRYVQNLNFTPLASLGAPTHGGFYGGEILLAGQPHGIIWAPKDQGQIKGPWHHDFELIDGACHPVDGLANTQAMAAAGSEIAQQILALRIDGHNDWHIPGRDVLEQGYFHLKPGTAENYRYWRSGENPSTFPPRLGYVLQAPTQTDLVDFRKGAAQAFDLAWYWSSTQYSADNAWARIFEDGGQGIFNKDGGDVFVRAVRLIPIQ